SAEFDYGSAKLELENSVRCSGRGNLFREHGHGSELECVILVRTVQRHDRMVLEWLGRFRYFFGRRYNFDYEFQQEDRQSESGISAEKYLRRDRFPARHYANRTIPSDR